MPESALKILSDNRILPIESEEEIKQVFHLILGRIMKKINNDRVLELFKEELEYYGGVTKEAGYYETV